MNWKVCNTLWLFGIVLYLVTSTAASAGDRDTAFQKCVSKCGRQPCETERLAISLRLTGWTCLDNCKYTCMHAITDARIRRSQSILQYFGKWPFVRFAGMQEPASVVFSLLNLWVHVQGFQMIRKRVTPPMGRRPRYHPMKWYYIGLSVINMNAWVWSAVFHTRDTPATEKLDYFSAGLAILSGLYVAVVRIFHLYTQRRRRLLQWWSLACTGFYILHVGYLTLSSRFDYSYNIIANLVIGIIHNALWLLFSSPFWQLPRYPNSPISYCPPFSSKKPALFVFMTTAAMSLELLDFPPWVRVLDAHSLWHLATAPIAAYWYGFIVEDSHDETWRFT